jgi:molecular chaperone DnaJ
MAITKDYYRILNIKSSATIAEIKKAYRSLAMKYHPDKNPGDELAAAVFADSAEAYKVLSDNEARKRYNEERYLTAQQEYQRSVETIDTMIMHISAINRHIQNSDPFRLNKDALLYSIKQIFPRDINLLLTTNEPLLKQFLEKISFAASYLSTHQTMQLNILLQPLYEKNIWLQQHLNLLLQRQQKQQRWEKYKIALAVLITAILCVLIFFVAKK